MKENQFLFYYIKKSETVRNLFKSCIIEYSISLYDHFSRI